MVRGLAFYLCKVSTDYPLLPHGHPFSLAVREERLLPRVDAWLASIFGAIRSKTRQARSWRQLLTRRGPGYPEPTGPAERLVRRASLALGYPGGCEKLNKQLVDALSLVMMGPVRGVGQCLLKEGQCPLSPSTGP